MNQNVVIVNENYNDIDSWISANQLDNILLVCDSSIGFLKINDYFNQLEKSSGINVIRFSDFKSNPLYDSVVEGVSIFNREHCSAIIAVGGGSAMDVAKCIKLYAYLDHTQNYLTQKLIPNDIPFAAVPTTAGTGSEATRYAVIYYEGEKQSISDYSCIPSFVIMDPSVLTTLPIYQKKCTMLDALCHSIESMWSVNSTPESLEYSRTGIRMVLDNMEAYLANDPEGNLNMLKAANVAGKAINITQTTAGHAMSYKITSLYGIPHGAAVAMCLYELLPYMVDNIDECIDSRGGEYLKAIFKQIAAEFGCIHVDEAIEKFQRIINSLELKRPKANARDLEVLVDSVNPVRLKNNPIALHHDVIVDLYNRILFK